MKRFGLLFLICLLTSCGGSNNSTDYPVTPTIGSASDLTLYSPQLVPVLDTMVSITTKSDINTKSYIRVQNNSSVAVTNIKYDITNQIDGGSILIDSNQCTSIDPHSNCTITVAVSGSAVGGGFAITATNPSGHSAPRAIGVEKVSQTNESGINGVKVFYYDTLPVGDKYAVLTGIVTSANAQSFNTVEVLTSDGKYINEQMPLSLNLGSNKTVLNLGDTFEVLVPVPANIGTQAFKFKLSNVQNNIIQDEVTSDNNTIDISNAGVLDTLNSSILFTNNIMEQTIYLVNMGKTPVTVKNITNTDTNIQIADFSQNTVINAGSYLAVKVKLIKIVPITDNGIVITYNNGVRDVPILVNVSINAIFPPEPYADLSLTMQDYDFYTTTAIGRVAQELTITNTGNTNEKDFIFNLPTGFSISDLAGDTNKCTLSGNKIVNTLAPGASCLVSLVYTNNIATPQEVASIIVSYNYDDTQYARETLTVSYRVTQSSANLSISPTSYGFNSILANGEQDEKTSLVITNLGEARATNLLTFIDGSQVFKIDDNSTCDTSLDAGSSCSISLKFGPTVESGLQNADLKIKYDTYLDVSAELKAALSGNVMSINSGLFVSQVTNATGFISGSLGTESKPYLLNQGSNGSLTYTITNKGNVTASNFSITYLSLPTNVIRTGYTCSNELKVNDSCSITFTLQGTDPVSFTANQSNLVVNWTDVANPNGTSQNLPQNLVYFQVLPLSYLVATTDPALDIDNHIFLLKGQTFSVQFALKNGYGVTTDGVITTDKNGIIFPNGDFCGVSSESPVCTVNMQVANTAEDGIIKLSLKTNSSLQVVPSLITVLINGNNKGYSMIWTGGSSVNKESSVYGVLGQASASNTPGARVREASTSYKNFIYVYGGYTYGSLTQYQNDLWVFDTNTNQWTWISGSNQGKQYGVYGTLGQPSSNNYPGGREEANISYDSVNKYIYLFGGRGYGSSGSFGALDDLWRYDIQNKTWTWLSGHTIPQAKNYDVVPGVYGIQGVPSSDNTPGSKSSAISWVDQEGNFWIFGGSNTNGNSALMKFDVSVNQWVWVNGAIESNSPAIYGALKVANPNNHPNSRTYINGWVDRNNNLWMFGGVIYGSPGEAYNDLWRYDTNTNQWTWMSGNNMPYPIDTTYNGLYGVMGVANSTNIPGPRYSSNTTTNIGNTGISDNILYIYGGLLGENSYADLWEYNINTGLWTWSAGQKNNNSLTPVYGTQDINDPNNRIGGNIGGVLTYLSDGSLVLWGGSSGGGVLANLNLYSAVWTIKPRQ